MSEAAAAVAESNDKNENGENPATEKRSRVIVKKTRELLRSLRETPVVPFLLVFGLGFRLGRSGLLRAGETAASSAAPGSTTAVAASSATATAARRFPVLSLVLTAVFVREVWRIIPSWAKPSLLPGRLLGIARRKSASGDAAIEVAEEEEEDSNDMTSLAAIAIKLQSVFALVSQKLASNNSSINGVELSSQQQEQMEEESRSYLRASFLAFIMLIAQLKEQRSQDRDDLYFESGQVIEDPETAMEGLDEAFEFADWAYDESPLGTLRENLERCKFNLLRHEKTPLPGSVAHYVAISPERKLALIGVKGTSNFEDMLTDCCGQAVTFELERPFVEGENSTVTMRCHEGVLISAQRLTEDVQPFVEHLCLPNGYNILITGHSLGAGAAAILGVMLRSRIPYLAKDDGTRLRVLAYASPPVLDHDTAKACAPFVTTIVNNSDIIPRASVSNLLVMVEFLKIVQEKLKAKGSLPENWKSTSKYLEMLTQGKNGEMFMSPDEIREGLDSAYEKVELIDPDHLYVPGRVLHMYDTWAKQKEVGKVEEESDTTEVKNPDRDDKATDSIVRTAEYVYQSDGTSKMLRLIEIDSRMLTDHLAPGYRSSIKSLLPSEEVESLMKPATEFS